MQVNGIVLAGGKSSRMGTNKSLLPIDGKPSITHVTNELKKFSQQTAVITNDPASYTFLELDMYSDRYEGMGPLAGIEAGLHYSSADVCAFAACDMPFIDRKVYRLLLQSMGSYDAVIPVYDNKMHPLAGVYRKRVLPRIQNLLDDDQRKVRTLFRHINVLYVSDYKNIPSHVQEKHFFNMNNRDQYKEAKHL
ncbi:molybdenum cofactor guanylyltransferase [Lentibacillus lipolyticus]|nr:molybdenum cofactor guanylyltransferase [Lentibacillus lipolyticus]